MSAGNLGRLGRYELLEVLGRGAMGVVYKAHDSFLDRTVAVKTYRQDIALNDSVRRRFEREVRTASKLIHPNVVTVYDGGLEGEVPFLAMEFVQGTTLEEELERRGKLSVPEALALIFQVVEGLAYAHAQNVIHRDLKPANILLSKSGQLKIADFGVAKVMTADTGATVNPVGTPSYMSPEQVSGKAIDVRADVFAIGILAYQLLTGEKPFSGDTWTTVLFHILNTEPKPPTEVRPELPRRLNAMLARAMHKDVAQRTADVLTFGRELREAFEAETGETAATTAAAPRGPHHLGPEDEEPRIAKREGYHVGEEPHLDFDPGDLEAFRGLQSERPRRTGTTRYPLWLALLLLVMVGIALAFFFARRDETPVVPPAATMAVPTVEPTVAPPALPTIAPTVAQLPTAVPTVPPTRAPTRRPTRPPTPEPEPTLPPEPTPLPTRAPAPPPPRVPTTAPVVVPPPLVLPSKETATMDIISTPPRAEVLVNGRVKGKAPIRIGDLEPGRYDFEIRLDGYVPYRRQADLEGRARYEMNVTLVPVVNSLRVVSDPPGASVNVNGAARGRTPLLLSGLASGTYVVEVALEGFPTERQTIRLGEGELRELRVRFTSGE